MMTVYNCNCLHVKHHQRYLSLHRVSLFLHLPVSEIVNVLPDGVYCCFTGTTCTLFTTEFTMITLVCSLNSMCIPRSDAVSVSYYATMSYYAHLCPYHKVWPEVVLQEL